MYFVVDLIKNFSFLIPASLSRNFFVFNNFCFLNVSHKNFFLEKIRAFYIVRLRQKIYATNELASEQTNVYLVYHSKIRNKQSLWKIWVPESWSGIYTSTGSRHQSSCYIFYLSLVFPALLSFLLSHCFVNVNVWVYVHVTMCALLYKWLQIHTHTPKGSTTNAKWQRAIALWRVNETVWCQ